jgi:opacity protein-like surface antigen
MNKIAKLSVASLLLTSVSIPVLADNYNIGLSGSYGKFEASGNQTKDGVKKNESGDAEFPFASIFVEYNKTMSKEWDVAFGLDYIPFSAEIEDGSRADTGGDLTGTNGTDAGANKVANASVAGTKTATLDLKNHKTIYIQPTYNLGNGLALFGKVGYSHADLEINSRNTATGSSLNKKDDLEGYLVGLGVQKNIDKTMFVRFEANYTDYSSVTYTNTSGTQFTADPELWAAKISIGKSF